MLFCLGYSVLAVLFYLGLVSLLLFVLLLLLTLLFVFAFESLEMVLG